MTMRDTHSMEYGDRKPGALSEPDPGLALQYETPVRSRLGLVPARPAARSRQGA